MCLSPVTSVTSSLNLLNRNEVKLTSIRVDDSTGTRDLSALSLVGRHSAMPIRFMRFEAQSGTGTRTLSQGARPVYPYIIFSVDGGP